MWELISCEASTNSLKSSLVKEGYGEVTKNWINERQDWVALTIPSTVPREVLHPISISQPLQLVMLAVVGDVSVFEEVVAHTSLDQ